MEGACVGLFDTDDRRRESFVKQLNDLGHRVVISAHSSGDAWVQIQDYRRHRSRLDVALLDLEAANSSEEDHTAEVIEWLRKIYKAKVKIVNVSSTVNVPAGVDEQIREADIAVFLKYIKDL